MKKTTLLKNLINRPELSFLMEAHNGLSAKVAEEAGFEGIWGSGLSISAALGVRDNNEASWTQVLEVAEFMSDATSIPILLDGDTGYGDFNTMQRVVRKLESRGVAGVCIEDKIYPKTNSLIDRTAQPLADVEEFSGKIKAGKDAQEDDDFVIVARVEAFIAGWGLEEALKRAEAYRQAGADAILMHSALRSPTEILEFKQEWGDRHPVVIVPTKYYTTPTEVFREHGFSVVIWANHLMRSSVAAMQRTAATIKEDEHLLNVEDRVAALSEVFRLQGAKKLAEAEKRYLPAKAKMCSAIVLAAARGDELGELSAERPKCMVEIAGRPLLSYIAETYRTSGVTDITVVRGYKKETVDLVRLNYVDNDDFETTGELYSLQQAAVHLEGTCIVSYGDVLFKRFIVQELVETDADVAVIVDANWGESRNKERLADYVVCSEPNSRQASSALVTLKEVVADADHEGIHGEWMGLFKVSPWGAELVKGRIEALSHSPDFAAMKVPDLLNTLVRTGIEVQVVYTTGHWLDIDSVEDVLLASAFCSGPRGA